LSGPGGVFSYERNPYYWKVDAAGNQLPYMDRVQMEVIEDRQTQFARTIMGDFDYLGERSSLKNLPMLAAAQKKGLLKMIIPYFHRSALDFKLNYNFPDPAFQEVVNDIRFRKALNYAINRPEILKTFYLNKFAKLEGRAFDGEFSKEKANNILDEVGMTKRDANGFRMTPSGKHISILFEQNPFSQDHIPMGELISEYWKEVGINTSLKAGDWNIISARLNNNEVQALGLWAHTEIWDGGWDDFLPKNQWGVQWHSWMNTGGKSGIEPPANVKKIYALEKEYNSQLVGTPASQKALDGIFKFHRENSYVFQPTAKARYPTMVTSRIHNVPLGMVDEMGIVIMYSMEQWYIDE
jgi:peptide/nickel transport system substrate-binding protein